MRGLAIGLLLALAGGSALAAPRLAVTLHHAVRMPMAAPAASVVVSDPRIADVMVVDRTAIFVRGKAYGHTEIHALDDLGRTVWQGEVVVTDGGEGRVTVLRALRPTDYSCAAARECGEQAPDRAEKGGGGAPAAAPAPAARTGPQTGLPPAPAPVPVG